MPPLVPLVLLVWQPWATVSTTKLRINLVSESHNLASWDYQNLLLLIDWWHRSPWGQEAACEQFPSSQAVKKLADSTHAVSRLHKHIVQWKNGGLISRFVWNFWILGMCSAFSGLHNFLDCAEHSHIHSWTGTHTCAWGWERTLPLQ